MKLNIVNIILRDWLVLIQKLEYIIPTSYNFDEVLSKGYHNSYYFKFSGGYISSNLDKLRVYKSFLRDCLFQNNEFKLLLLQKYSFELATLVFF